MSIRVDTSSLIAGAIVCGNRGLGVLGSEVAGEGEHGDGILFNDVEPGDEDKEFRALIEEWPAAGDLFVYEDGSFILEGAPDGEYTFVYRLFVDGQDLGTATASIAIGEAEAVEGESASVIGEFASSGAGTPVNVGSGASTIGEFGSEGAGASGDAVIGAGDSRIDEFTSAGEGTPVVTAEGASTIGEFGSDGAGAVAQPVTGEGASAIGEFASQGAGSPVIVGAGASTIGEFVSVMAHGTPRAPKTFRVAPRRNVFTVPAA